MKRIFSLGLIGTALLWCVQGFCCSPATSSLLVIANAHMRQGKWEEAKAELGQISETASACAEILLAQARIAAAEDRTDQAVALFRSYIQRAPDDPEGYAYFARAMMDSGDEGSADQLSQIAMAKGPDDAAALAVRGQSLAAKGDKQGAVSLLTRACALWPDDEEAAFQLGSVYDRAKLPGEAEKHFARATEINHDDARAWDYLALQLEPLGKLSDAESAFETAVAVNHEGPYFDAFLDYNFGRFLMKKGDFTRSKKHLDRAVLLVPDMRATWYERARVEILMKDFAAARPDAEKAASIEDPDGLVINLQIYAMLEQIYRRVGETELANKYAELARKTPPPVRGERH